MTTKPSNAVLLERVMSMGNEACFTIALQCRRIRNAEPEDEVFLFRREADIRFLIIALVRLRRCALLAIGVDEISAELKSAIETFDNAIPFLVKLRNVDQHIDDYLLGLGRRKDVQRGDLQVNTWDGSTFGWLGEMLNIDLAEKAASELFSAIRNVSKQWKPPPE